MKKKEKKANVYVCLFYMCLVQSTKVTLIFNNITHKQGLAKKFNGHILAGHCFYL